MAEKKFDTKMKRLETIAEQLEKGSLELDKAVKYYEEAAELAAECRKELDDAESKVTIITERGEKVFEGEQTDADI